MFNDFLLGNWSLWSFCPPNHHILQKVWRQYKGFSTIAIKKSLFCFSWNKIKHLDPQKIYIYILFSCVTSNQTLKMIKRHLYILLSLYYVLEWEICLNESSGQLFVFSFLFFPFFNKYYNFRLEGFPGSEPTILQLLTSMLLTLITKTTNNWQRGSV